jgi:hypothetical protein
VAASIRHGADHAAAADPVTGSRRALIAGLAIAAVYLVGAVASGRISPLARRPLLDGFAPPPPYRWVRPPPSLAATNQPPSGGGFVIVLDPTAGSEAGVFSTDDSQASLALGEGAISTKTGDSSVLLEITPLAPAGAATVPRGMQLIGNVYRISATSQPSSSSVGTLTESGQLVLAYPASADGLLHRHTLLRSADGRSWTAIQSIDSIGQHLAQGNVSKLGYFIVGQSRVGTASRSSIRTTIYRVILFAGLTAIVVAIAVAELRSRRKTSRSPGQGRRRRPGSS